MSFMVAAALIWGLPIAAAAAIGSATVVSRSARAVVVRHLVGEQETSNGAELRLGAARTPYERSQAAAQVDLAITR